jgi:hypothetical protein
MKMHKNIKLITLLIQLGLVAIYFAIYKWSLIAALIFSAIFMVADMFSWPGAIKSHEKDDKLIFLIVTIATSGFAIIAFFANAYEYFGEVLHGGITIKGLGEHLYFSAVTFTTLGYGDYLPHGYAKLFAVLEALLGFAYFAFIVGVSGSLFYSKTSNA